MSRTVFRKTIAVLVAEVLLTATPRAAPLPDVGALVTMGSDYFGCHALEDLARVINLDWVKNDKIASIEYGKQHCIVLHKDDKFNVQDSSSIQGAVCLRAWRARECFWTSAQMLAGAAPP